MRSLIFLIIVALSYALLRGWPESWHLILRICLAGILILTGLGIWGRSTPTSSPIATPHRPPRWIDFLTTVAAIIFIELLFLAFLSTTPEKAEQLAEILDEKLHPESHQGSSSTDPGTGSSKKGSSTISGNWLFDHDGSRSLRNGQVQLSNKPEVYLWPETKEDAMAFQNPAAYLRSFTLANYENKTWTPLLQTPQTFPAQENRITLIPEPHPPNTIACEVYHLPNLGKQSLAVAPPYLLTIDLPFVRQTGPTSFRLPPLNPNEKSYRYRVTSAPQHFDTLPPDLELSPDFEPDASYLQIPSDPAIREALLAISSTASGDLRERLSHIRSHLINNHHYTLAPTNPENLDPLTNFLTGSREGYCDHFSTASVLLIRSLGIPARVAYGWSGGRYFSSRNMFVFRAREAHAWAEIHLADFGWVTFDATPPNREAATASFAEEDELPPSTPDLDFEYDEDDLQAADPFAYFKPLALGLGGLTFLGLLALLIFRRPSSLQNTAHPAASLLPRNPGYLKLFRRACAATGHPMPSGRTLRQHLEGMAEKNQAPECSDALLSYHYAITYGNQPRQKGTEKKLVSILKEWERRTTSGQNS